MQWLIWVVLYAAGWVTQAPQQNYTIQGDWRGAGGGLDT